MARREFKAVIQGCRSKTHQRLRSRPWGGCDLVWGRSQAPTPGYPKSGIVEPIIENDMLSIKGLSHHEFNSIN